jgi:hypothetical protein
MAEVTRLAAVVHAEQVQQELDSLRATLATPGSGAEVEVACQGVVLWRYQFIRFSLSKCE